MRAPEIPANEEARLGALRAYDVLDTAEETSFDALTKLAAGIVGTPIALVSLVDERRQWFKSRYGLNATETPREVSFCGHVVAEEAPLVVPDAHQDVRFAGNPLVTGEPRVRFYAGMPLRTPDGFVLGSLCAIDREPRQPTQSQLELLQLLAGQVVDQLEARRKRRELLHERESARESASRLTVLFEGMAEGVVLQDGQGKIALANRAATELLGMTFEQLTGKTSLDATWHALHEDGTPFPGDSHPATVALRTGRAVTNVVMGVNRSDGAIVWLSINALPLQNEREARPHGVIITFYDVTATRTARLTAERLSRQERLVTTGTLAAGVGHEVNNPLAFVHGNLEFAIEELRNFEGGTSHLRQIRDALHEARSGTERIRKIVRGLQSLSREESPPVPTEVSDPVEVAINLASHEIRHRASIVKRLSPTPRILADDARLAQALVSLLVNAGQAFESNDVQRNLVVVGSELRSDGRVAISISDNGPGIAPELQKRVFDPFFSTKEVGKGTGLGLSIAQTVVTAMGGELQLTSALGKGSTFRIVLPAAPPVKPPEPVAETRIEAERRGRVLAIDDEPIILRTITRVLEKEHEVTALEDSRKALELLRSGATFDVIFCDLMMPDLPGNQLYAQVKAARPELAERFVFVSGGVTQPEMVQFLEDIPNERLEKPFSVQNLRGIARRFLEPAKAAP